MLCEAAGRAVPNGSVGVGAVTIVRVAFRSATPHSNESEIRTDLTSERTSTPVARRGRKATDLLPEAAGLPKPTSVAQSLRIRSGISLATPHVTRLGED
jgi:hypothetical protein